MLKVDMTPNPDFETELGFLLNRKESEVEQASAGSDVVDSQDNIEDEKVNGSQAREVSSSEVERSASRSSSRRGRKPKNVKPDVSEQDNKDTIEHVHVYIKERVLKDILLFYSSMTGKSVSQLVYETIREKYYNEKTLKQIREYVNNKFAVNKL